MAALEEYAGSLATSEERETALRESGRILVRMLRSVQASPDSRSNCVKTSNKTFKQHIGPLIAGATGLLLAAGWTQIPEPHAGKSQERKRRIPW